ncbi:MAG: excalibur calcium-binding domain-containing protein [Proteobacteria bacterium]|nr:excalibur calcium-binding domain-containing protein [Pseudomonadota bacterium]
MKNLLLLVVISIGAWLWIQEPTPPTISTSAPTTFSIESPVTQPASTTRSVSFSCDGRQYCSEMTSRAEAEFFVRNCPNTRMDGDNDGFPCENDSRF